jgi:hypothetical protein
MIPVLFAAARVAARRLQMAIWIFANPNIGPRGWNCERLDSAENFGVANRATSWIEVAE